MKLTGMHGYFPPVLFPGYLRKYLHQFSLNLLKCASNCLSFFSLRTNRVLSKVVDQVAEKIIGTSLLNDNDSAVYIRLQYESMIPLQQQLLWQRLLKRVPLPHDNLNVLKTVLSMSNTQNAEIRYRLVKITLIRSTYSE